MNEIMKQVVYQKEVYSTAKLLAPIQFGDKFQIYPINGAGDEYREGYHYSVLEYRLTLPENIERESNFSFLPDNEYEQIYASVKETKEALKLICLLSVISNTAFYEHTIEKGKSRTIKRKRVSGFSPLPIDEEQNDNAEIITFNSEVTEFLTIYYGKPDEEKLIYDSAAHLIYHAKAIFDRTHDVSMSFLSYVSSIEALLNIDFKSSSETCPCCGVEKYRVTAKFKDFLKKYVGRTSKDQKLFDKIYDRRSKLTHTGQLFFHSIEKLIDNQAKGDLWLHHIASIAAIQAFKNSVLKLTTNENNRSYLPSESVNKYFEWRRSQKNPP